MNPYKPERLRLLLVSSLILTLGFLFTGVLSFIVSRNSLRDTILHTELPLTSDTVYSEIKRDLVQPIFISSMMAKDTFLRDWLLGGEEDISKISRYLKEIQGQFNVFTSFLVSESSRRYYTAGEALKRVNEYNNRDVWYFRVRIMPEDYEINVDPDMAHDDAMTIFINYKIFDYSGNYLGATGVGLTIDTVQSLIMKYEEKYQRTIYFTDPSGTLKLSTNPDRPRGENLELFTHKKLEDLIRDQSSGSLEYETGNKHFLLNYRYIPDLDWYLFIEKDEALSIHNIKITFLINTAISLVLVVLVILLFNLNLAKYQKRLEAAAGTDTLTQVYNRNSFDLLSKQVLKENTKAEKGLYFLMLDADKFKQINDQKGHQVGDSVLQDIAGYLKTCFRDPALIFRWGGEEFLVVLSDCSFEEAIKLSQTALDLTRSSENSASMRLTLSAGLARLEPGEDLDSLIKRADQALYKAKAAGRNTLILAD